MSKHGRLFQISLEFAVGCGICLLLVLLVPLSLWRDIGQPGGMLLVLGIATFAAGAFLLRHRRPEGREASRQGAILESPE